MLVIGLTGGIASGKSTISRTLRRLGAEIIDADLVAKELMRPGSRVYTELVETFGPGILNRNRTINRKALGKIVFSNPGALQKLNSITHPAIVETIKERLDSLSRSPGRPEVVVIDAPLLIETGMHGTVDEVWVVDVTEEQQIERLMKRDKYGYEEAVRRLKSQMPRKEKLRYADRVIDNSGPPARTRKKIEDLWKEIVCRRIGISE